LSTDTSISAARTPGSREKQSHSQRVFSEEQSTRKNNFKRVTYNFYTALRHNTLNPTLDLP
jgi:hypothetical protein